MKHEKNEVKLFGEMPRYQLLREKHKIDKNINRKRSEAEKSGNRYKY